MSLDQIVEEFRTAYLAGERPDVAEIISRVPEADRELPQSITTIMPGDTGGELWMTKGHQHPDHQGEIYLALQGQGGLGRGGGGDGDGFSGRHNIPHHERQPDGGDSGDTDDGDTGGLHRRSPTGPRSRRNRFPVPCR